MTCAKALCELKDGIMFFFLFNNLSNSISCIHRLNVYRVNCDYICIRSMRIIFKEAMSHLVENDAANDGSWQISILVTDLNIQRNLYVTGSLHIGGLMLRLVDEVGSF